MAMEEVPLHVFPIKKMLNIIFSHCACNGSKIITCSTSTELASISKALESIIVFRCSKFF